MDIIEVDEVCARLDELNLLLRVSRGVASSLNLADSLPPILQGALTATGASGARIVLLPNEDSRAGLGLGLSIARQSIEADHGTLTVRDVPGSGCIFTISLPRYSLQ